MVQLIHRLTQADISCTARLFFFPLLDPRVATTTGAIDDSGERGRHGRDGLERHDGLGRGVRHGRIHGPKQLLLARLRQGWTIFISEIFMERLGVLIETLLINLFIKTSFIPFFTEKGHACTHFLIYIPCIPFDEVHQLCTGSVVTGYSIRNSLEVVDVLPVSLHSFIPYSEDRI